MIFNKKHMKFSNGNRKGGPLMFGCWVVYDSKASLAVFFFFKHKYLQKKIRIILTVIP